MLPTNGDGEELLQMVELSVLLLKVTPREPTVKLMLVAMAGQAD
jgi:hypothetical protein